MAGSKYVLRLHLRSASRPDARRLRALEDENAKLKKLLGHSRVQTTARYAHLAEDPVKAAAGKVSDMISAAVPGRRAAKRPGQGKAGRMKRCSGMDGAADAVTAERSSTGLPGA